MDNRLFNIVTRPVRLRKQDLPLVARALVSYFRRQAVVKTGFVRNISYVRFEASDFKVQILASDWAKIQPYVKDGTFVQSVVPSQGAAVVIDPVAVQASALIDQTDRQYYLYVLGILEGLFPEAYPTSNL